MKEIWKSIEGYEGLYDVSNYGRVYSHRSHRMLTPHINKYRGDRRTVILCVENEKKHQYISRLVANAFLERIEGLDEVDHIIPISDGGGDEVWNLRWVDRKENMNNPNTRNKLTRYWSNDERNKKISERMRRNNPTLNMTEEWRLNIGRSHKGKPNTKCRKKVRQLTLDGRIVNEYDSLTIAAQSVGTRCGDISSAINGRQKTAKGYRWEYC